MFSPQRYVDAMRFAAERHHLVGQKEPGTDLPYLVHVVSVAAEVIAVLQATELADPDLAVTCALLHDTVEDTAETDDDRKRLLREIEERFGPPVAAGVAALSKNEKLPTKQEQMADSLERIKLQPPEIAVVKLADRTTNMAAPPHYWTNEKRRAYREEALVIADALGYASAALEARLRARIEAYKAYC